MESIILSITSDPVSMNRRPFGELQKMMVRLFDEYDVSIQYEDNTFKTSNWIPTKIKVTLTSMSQKVAPLVSTLMAGETVPFTDGNDTFYMSYCS